MSNSDSADVDVDAYGDVRMNDAVPKNYDEFTSLGRLTGTESDYDFEKYTIKLGDNKKQQEPSYQSYVPPALRAEGAAGAEKVQKAKRVKKTKTAEVTEAAVTGESVQVHETSEPEEAAVGDGRRTRERHKGEPEKLEKREDEAIIGDSADHTMVGEGIEVDCEVKKAFTLQKEANEGEARLVEIKKIGFSVAEDEVPEEKVREPPQEASSQVPQEAQKEEEKEVEYKTEPKNTSCGYKLTAKSAVEVAEISQQPPKRKRAPLAITDEPKIE